jgi:hypothetical protein
MDMIIRFICEREDKLPTSETYRVYGGVSQQELLVSQDQSGYRVTLPQLARTGPVDAQLLWNLLPPAVQDKIVASPQAVQLMIESGNAAVDALPWEGLQAKKRGLSRLSVARIVPLLLQPPPLTVVPPLRLLIIASNARDERTFSDRETMLLRKAMNSNTYNVRELLDATATSVLEAVKEFEPHIVHYLGHGGIVSGEGAVVLRDERTGMTNWIRVSQVSQALPVSTRLLCLSTGFSRPNFDILGLVNFAHAPQSLRLPTCIINRADVDESSVSSFWRMFYDTLAQSKGNVLEAYNASTAELHQRMAGAENSFSLVLRDGGTQPLRLGMREDTKRLSAELQAQFAARLATDLDQKLRSFHDTESGSALRESISEERNRFDGFSSTAASFDSDS